MKKINNFVLFIFTALGFAFTLGGFVLAIKFADIPTVAGIAVVGGLLGGASVAGLVMYVMGILLDNVLTRKSTKWCPKVPLAPREWINYNTVQE